MTMLMSENPDGGATIFNTITMGILSKDVAGSGDIVLDDTTEARNQIHKYTGVLTGARAVVVPAESKTYFVHNATSGAYALKVKRSGGSGVVIGQGKKALLYCDGTDVFRLTPDLIDSVLDDTFSKALSDANYTLSTSTDPQEWQYEMLEFTGALTDDRDIVVPVNTKKYFIYNNTTGGFSLWVKVTGQTGIEVTATKRAILWCDGTDELQELQIKQIAHALVKEIRAEKHEFWVDNEAHYQDHMQRMAWGQEDYDDLRNVIRLFKTTKGLFWKFFIGFAIIGLSALVALGLYHKG